MPDQSLLEDVVLELESLGGIKFGNFTLKGGIQSPVYFDLRVVVKKPTLMKKTATLLQESFKVSGKADPVVLCGVPYTALPLATFMALDMDLPMLIKRKEAKAYGTKQAVEGLDDYMKGKECLVVEVIIYH